jgi:hypothetical protein
MGHPFIILRLQNRTERQGLAAVAGLKVAGGRPWAAAGQAGRQAGCSPWQCKDQLARVTSLKVSE